MKIGTLTSVQAITYNFNLRYIFYLYRSFRLLFSFSTEMTVISFENKTLEK